MTDAAVELRNVVKRFGGVVALDGASLTLPKGKVTALVGDNGAGKSSLVKVLSGVYVPDEGEVRVGSGQVQLVSPRDARRYGIHTVFQNLALVGSLNVVQNVFLGDEIYRRCVGLRTPFLDTRRMTAETRDALERLNVTTLQDILQPVEVLSGGQRQTIAIARAVRQDAELLILDEPTAALGVKQARQVFQAVERIREAGTAVLVVSHNLREVFSSSDRIAVMRFGRVISVFETAQVSEEDVVSAIVGAGPAAYGGPIAARLGQVR